ncbi:hypothetical protein MKY20_20250 [Cytobacillus sp. FSL W8-0315]|uniref:hypothetical protein n=1 Tax=Cytobacillus sp. FSL W8-0315 TaxID=2921600 RepID=UPI0030F8F517
MKNNMPIDQQLEIIREALVMGADITLNFHGINSREEGFKIINEMSSLTGAAVKDGSTTFQLDYFESPVNCTVFYKLSMEEEKERLLQELNRMNAELAKGDDAIEKAN